MVRKIRSQFVYLMDITNPSIVPHVGPPPRFPPSFLYHRATRTRNPLAALAL